MNDNMSQFDVWMGLGLAQLRIKRGLSLIQLAHRAGIPEHDFQAYEAGTQLMSAQTLFLISRALDIGPGAILSTLIDHAASAPQHSLKTYAAHRLDDAGLFKTGRWIDAFDDESATCQAASLFEADTVIIQLWSGSKRLGNAQRKSPI